MNENTRHLFRDGYDTVWPDINTSKSKRNSQSQHHSSHHSYLSQVSSFLPTNGGRDKAMSFVASNPSTNNKQSCNPPSYPKVGYQQSYATNNQQFSTDHFSHYNTVLNNPNKTSSKKGNSVVNDFCVCWNNVEDYQCFYQNNNKHSPPQNYISSNSQDSSASQISEKSASLSESEDMLEKKKIIAQKRLKLAEKRQMQKLETRQLKQIVSGVQAAKPDFSLEQAAEDFPSLNVAKKPKKQKPIKNEVISELEGRITSEVTRPNPVEKSWKPKIKDPICFDINQALQAKPEKAKTVQRKVDPTARDISVGNILDSDNPQRKRGKVRPDQVRKPTKLKEKILQERSEKQRKMRGEDQEDSFPLPEEIAPEVIDPLKDSALRFDDEISTLLAKLAVLESNIEKSNADREIDSNSVEISDTLKKVHSKKFRDYCTNCLTEDIITSVCLLLEKVAYFQDRTFARDPIKANAKRRYVAGLHQTTKYLRVKKVKLLVIAPDLEKNPGKGGLDEKIRCLKKEAESQGVPCVFGPNRRRLGKAVIKNAMVSSVAVLSYEGAEELFSKVLESLQNARTKYLALTGQEIVVEKEESASLPVPVKESCENDVTSSLLAALKAEMCPADKLLGAINNSPW